MTTFDPKVVSFKRNASYLHEHAMKNRRAGLNADALELFRKACEQEPDNVEYKLDLAQLYSEMGLYEQASRVFTEVLLKDKNERDCLYGMAVNLFKQGEVSRAERALSAYVEAEKDGRKAAEARRLMDEISIAKDIGRPSDRKLWRAMRLSASACDQMNAGNNLEGARLFEKSLDTRVYSAEVRALYAHSLMSLKRDGEALEQARTCLREMEKAGTHSLRAMWLSAQVFEQLGQTDEAGRLMKKAVTEAKGEQDMQLKAFMLMDLERFDEADEVIGRVLLQTPYDKQFLHMSSVARYNQELEDEEIKQGWSRIKRLDQFDPIADYYLKAMDNGAMPPRPMPYAYAIPVHEAIRRVQYITEKLIRGGEALKDAWETDSEFRKILEWEIYQKESRVSRLALATIMNVDTEETRGILRTFSQRPDISMKQRLYSMYLMKTANIPNIPILDMSFSQAVMPCEEEIMEGLSVSEKQMARFAAEYIEEEHGEYPLADIALIWRTFREARGMVRDPVRRCETGSAALALFYMEMRGYEGNAVTVSRYFRCPARQTAYIAKAIRHVFHANAEDE